jgi:hypothetical protein
MVVQPSSNSTPNIFLECHCYSNTFRKNPNRFRIGDVAITVSGGRRRTDGRRARRTYPGLVNPGVDRVFGALEPMEQPGLKRSGKQMKEGRHDFVKLLLMTVILGVWRKGRRDISDMSAVPHSPTLISEDRRR